MKYKNDINKNIFRGYDIRGIYPTEIDEDTAYTIGLGFGSYIKSIGKTSCIVGHDNRLSGEVLYNALIKGILETGIDIISIGLCTTPMYYYACIKLKVFSGVMVTASHNPKDDNGFKFAFDESGNCKGQEIQDFLAYILKGEFASGEGKVTEYDITNDYLELFRTNFNFGDRRVKAVIDPGNGTTGVIVRKIYEMFPIDLEFINEKSDGRFPNHHPDPCVEDNLQQLKDKVLETQADIGLGFDGDGDRMGMVSSTTKFIPTDKFMTIVVRDIIDKVDKKEFLCDVKCSKTFSDEVEKLGGKCITYRTGNSYTKAAVRDFDLPFGGELSGHVYFRDRWPGFDSGLYAGLRMLEILSNTDKTVDELLEGTIEYYSTEELKFKSTDDMKFKIVDQVKEYAINKQYDILDIDGVKVLFDDGWALVRASNTGPNLTARFEANTLERLEEIQKEFVKLINEFNKKSINMSEEKNKANEDNKKSVNMRDEKNKVNDNNKSSIYILIISFLIIIILLLVSIVFLLKRDTSVPLPVVDDAVEKELVVTDKLKLELSNKMNLLLGGDTIDSYNSNNRFSSSIFLESILINQLDDYTKQFIVLKNLEAVKDTSNRWMEQEDIKRIKDFDSSEQRLTYYGTISFDKYNNLYKDLFFDETPQPLKIAGSCPEYYYSDTYKEFYKITYVCGVVSYGDYISYISNYEIDEDNIYLYMNFGFIEPGYGDKTYVYGNFEEYEVSGSKGIKPINVVEEIDYQLTNSYVINDTNKDKFSEYKITFKNKNNKYYYEKTEKIK